MVCAIFIVYNFRIINSTIRKMWSLLIFLRTFNILIFYTEYLFTYNITRYSFNYIFTIFILSSRHDTFRKFYFRFTSGLMFFHINEYNYSPFETLNENGSFLFNFCKYEKTQSRFKIIHHNLSIFYYF